MWHKVLRWRRQLDGQLFELLRGSSIALTVKVAGAGLAFGFNVLLARTVGPEGAGLYFLALTVVTFAVVLGRMGLDKTVLRFVSAYSAEHDDEAVKGVQQKATIISLVAATVGTVIVFIFADPIATGLFDKPLLTTPLRLMSIAIIPMTLNFIYAHLLKGRKLIFQATLIESVIIMALSLVLFYFFGREAGLLGAVRAYLIAVVFTAVVAIWFWYIHNPQFRIVTGTFETRKIFSSSMPLLWVALTNWTIGQFGNFALGIWGTAADIGVFGVTYRLAFFVSFALLAVNSIAAPQFASLFRQRDRQTLLKSARYAIRLTTIAALPLTILFLLAPAWILAYFGPEFVSGALVLSILTVAQFVNAATGPVELMLMMMGQERAVRTNVLCVGLMTIVLYVWLVPRWGALGAAIAFAAGLIAKNILSVGLVYYYIGKLFSAADLTVESGELA